MAFLNKFTPANLPIKTRLAFAFACVSIVFLCVYSFVVYTVFDRYLLRDATDLVRAQYESILSDITFVEDESQGIDLAEKTLSRIDQATNLGLLVFVYDSNGDAIVSPSPISIPIGKE